MRKPTTPLYHGISERVFTQHVIEMARRLGYLCAHFRPARTEKGWRTPVEGDGAGFPDIIAIKPGRVIFAELKAGKGKVTPAQEKWLLAAKAAGIEVYCWFPKDIEAIERILK
jgi:hypothetical protein